MVKKFYSTLCRWYEKLENLTMAILGKLRPPYGYFTAFIRTPCRNIGVVWFSLQMRFYSAVISEL